MVKKDSTKKQEERNDIQKDFDFMDCVPCSWFDCWLIYRTIIQFKTN